MRKPATARQDDVLSVLRSCDRPMTAYQILEQLQASEPDIAPPTVYRTLSSLTDQGRAHRLESIRAFVPCTCSHAGQVPVLAICGDCGTVEEHDGGDLLPLLNRMTRTGNFQSERHIVEIHGRCGGCAA
ncbi:Fur family transcriptional regulator [uncultured Roseobacter sp.]|uniref:Fur family transcriptional regulator n=1 Tax=uncultured Roseobacter sp. TaxID=114847 RepID=UPI0026067121|nr:Fur family transcriptional regulator [uncultured Roseobacter sp.]